MLQRLALLLVAATPALACLTCKCEPLPDGTCCCVHPGCPPVPPSCPPPPNGSLATSGEEWRRDATTGLWRKAAAAPGGLSVAVAANGSYVVSVDGEPWFESAETFISSGGAVHSLGAGLALEKTTKTTGRDALGPFSQTTLTLRAASTPPQTVEFAIKAWDDGATLEFVQSFPRGLADSQAASKFSPPPPPSNCTTRPLPCASHPGRTYCASNPARGQCDKSSHPPCPPCPAPPPRPAGDPNAVSTSFPAWRPATLAGTQRGWMQYDGWDCDGKNGDCMKQDVAPAGHVAYGRWEDGTSELPGGLEGSGPMAIFASDLSRTVVVSAFTNTMAQSQSFVSDPPPGPPPKPAAVAWHETPYAYCVGSGAAWSSPSSKTAQPTPISLAACKAKAAQLIASGQANAFDYLYGPIHDPGTCGGCAVCRVGMARKVTNSSQNYTCWMDTAPPPPKAPGTLHYGLMGSVEEVPKGNPHEQLLESGLHLLAHKMFVWV